MGVFVKKIKGVNDLLECGDIDINLTRRQIGCSVLPRRHTKASFSSVNWGEKYCIRIPVAFRLYLVKIIQNLTN
jgi:hypothetical protein